MQRRDAMRFLIIGASGLVGWHLRSRLIGTGNVIGTCYRHYHTDLETLDATDREEVARLFDHAAPSAVFLSAAAADIDWCEANPNGSFAINVIAPRTVADLCRRHGTKLIFLSTDYVYDGRDGPYCEEDSPNPINVYGAHKLEAEREVLQRSPGAVIARTCAVYGHRRHPPDPLAGLLAAVTKGTTTTASKEHWTTPTFVDDLTWSLVELVTKDVSGIIHLGGPVACSRHEFALAVIRAAQLGDDAAALVQHGLPRTARPKRCGLRIDKATRLIGYDPVGYEQGLRTLLRESRGQEPACQNHTR